VKKIDEVEQVLERAGDAIEFCNNYSLDLPGLYVTEQLLKCRPLSVPRTLSRVNVYLVNMVTLGLTVRPETRLLGGQGVPFYLVESGDSVARFRCPTSPFSINSSFVLFPW